MRIIGVILIVLGAVVMAYALTGKTLSYETEKAVVEAGPLKVTGKEEHVIPTPLWAGVGGLALGALMVIAGRK